MASCSPVPVPMDRGSPGEPRQDTAGAADPAIITGYPCAPLSPPPASYAAAAAAPAAVPPPGSSHHTMLSAFAPAVNQAMAASADGSADGGGATPVAANAAPPPADEGRDMPLLLWDHPTPSGAAGRATTAHSLERVEEDVAALWWS